MKGMFDFLIVAIPILIHGAKPYTLVRSIYGELDPARGVPIVHQAGCKVIN